MHIRTRLDVHLAKMRTKVKNLTEEEFKVTVGSVLTDISEKDKNLREAFTRNWQEMAQHNYNFDKQDNDIAMIKTITLAEF